MKGQKSVRGSRNVIITAVFLGFFYLFSCEQRLADVFTPGVSISSKVNTNPGFYEKVIGKSVLDKPIKAYIWNDESRRPTLILTAMHGDERTSGKLGDMLLARWKQHPEELKGFHVILVTRVNPDGWDKGTRKNAHGIDINRNFPFKWESSDTSDIYYSGPKPLSEPETNALLYLVKLEQPDRIITVHSPMRNINYDGPALEIAEEIHKINKYPIKENIGYPTPGSFGMYAGKFLNIPTITLELPGTISDNNEWENNCRAIIAAILFELGEKGYQTPTKPSR